MKTRLVREFQDLYAYDRWANARTLDAASVLTPDALTQRITSSFASVLDTLAHILSAKWVWLSRWRGHSPTSWPSDWDVSTLPLLRERYQEVEDDLDAYLTGLRDEDLHRKLDYKTMDGAPFRQPLTEMLRHVVNHSTYHRGQVTTLLRQLGATPVATDLIRFYRERQGS